MPLSLAPLTTDRLAPSSLLIVPATHWPAAIAAISAQVHPGDFWQPAALDKPPTIKEVRELIRFASRTPVAGHMGAVLPWAEKMGQEPANALLKLLEEPPAPLSLLLLAEIPDLLPTVLSRATRLRPTPEYATIGSERPFWEGLRAAHPPTAPEDRERLRQVLHLNDLAHAGFNPATLFDPFRKP